MTKHKYKFDIGTVLAYKYPDVQGIKTVGDEIVDWPADRLGPVPTDKEIEGLLSAHAADLLRKSYEGKRLNAYPSTEDQLDYIVREGVTKYRAMMQAIKNKYPKPKDV